MRRRLDAEMVRRGLASSRSAANELVTARQVLVGGSVAGKSSRMVDPGDPLVLMGEPPRFVGRGGEKLAGGLEGFGLDVAGLRVLDAGASTGGFTDCLVQGGAAEVVALDVGHGQLHERIRRDSRVVVLEHTNLRHIGPDDVGCFDAAVADLSFISLTLVTGVLLELVRGGGWLVLLVKPQFESGRAEVSRGRGVIREPSLWTEALRSVADAVNRDGGAIMDAMASPLRGGQGNVEFLLHVLNGPCDPTSPDPASPGSVPRRPDPGQLIERAVEAAVEREQEQGAAPGEPPTGHGAVR